MADADDKKPEADVDDDAAEATNDDSTSNVADDVAEATNGGSSDDTPELDEEALEHDVLLSDDLPSPEAIRRKQRMRMLIVGVIIAVALVGVGWFIYTEMTKVELVPNKVVVAIEVVDSEGTTHAWWLDEDPSKLSYEWSGALANEMLDLGMKPLDFEKDEVQDALADATDDETLREAAEGLGASYVIHGRVEPAGTTPMGSTDMLGYIYELQLEVLDVGGDQGSATVLETPVRYIAAGRDEHEALGRNASYTSLYMPHLVMALVERPGMKRLIDGGDDVTLEEKEIANELEKLLFQYAEDWQKRFGERLEQVDDAEGRAISHEQSEHERTVLGEFISQEDLIGAREGEVLLLIEPLQYVFEWPPGEVGIDSTIERIVRAKPDGSDREVVMEHDNFYSSQALSPNTRYMAMIHDNGPSKTLAMYDLETSTYKPLVTHLREYYSSPAPSDDGKYVSFYSKPYRRGGEALEVINTETLERHTVIPNDAWTSWPAWVPGKNAFYVAVRYPSDDKASVYRYDIEKTELTPVLGVAKPTEETDAPVESSDEGEPDGTTDEGAADDGTADAEGDPFAGEAGDAVAGDGVPAVDPATIPDFRGVRVSPTGDFALTEERVDHTTWLGRLDLQSGEYTRIIEIDPRVMRISPDGKLVAIQLRLRGTSRDPAGGDDEIVVMPTSGGELDYLTLNAADDHLRAWSHDGKSVFATQYSRDPTYRRSSSRVYKIDL